MKLLIILELWGFSSRRTENINDPSEFVIFKELDSEDDDNDLRITFAYSLN